MPSFCAHCDVEIDHLQYSSNVIEWGSSDLDGASMDCNDSDIQETNYECPECSESINPEEDVIQIDEEEEEENAPPKDTTKVVKVWKDDMFAEGRYSRPSKIMQCKKCEHAFEVNDKDTDVECVKCNAKLTSKNLITV